MVLSVVLKKLNREEEKEVSCLGKRCKQKQQPCKLLGEKCKKLLSLGGGGVGKVQKWRWEEEMGVVVVGWEETNCPQTV